MSSHNAKRVVLAIGIGGVAASGAIYGAQLKQQREAEQAARAVEKNQSTSSNSQDPTLASQSVASVSEPAHRTPQQLSESEQAQMHAFNAKHVVALEHRRADLLRQRGTVEKKLEALLERKSANEARRRAVAGKSAGPDAGER